MGTARLAEKELGAAAAGSAGEALETHSVSGCPLPWAWVSPPPPLLTQDCGAEPSKAPGQLSWGTNEVCGGGSVAPDPPTAETREPLHKGFHDYRDYERRKGWLVMGE